MTSGYLPVQRPGTRALTRGRVRGLGVVRAVAAIALAGAISGDSRISVELILGVLIAYWHGVDTARLGRGLLLDRVFRRAAPYVPLALGCAWGVLVASGISGFLVNMVLPTAVAAAALRSGVLVAGGGWHWGAFARDLGYGATGRLAVATIGLCGAAWGETAGVVDGVLVVGMCGLMVRANRKAVEGTGGRGGE